jgi:hypothetical protein
MQQVKELKSIIVERWKAYDGKCFDSSEECMAYERSLDAAYQNIHNIENKSCYIPFTDWDMDITESKLFLLKSEEEHEHISLYYSREYDCDTDYWDKPKSYPAVLQVICREGYSAGHEINWSILSDFMEVMQSMNEYLCNKEQYKI